MRLIDLPYFSLLASLDGDALDEGLGLCNGFSNPRCCGEVELSLSPPSPESMGDDVC